MQTLAAATSESERGIRFLESRFSPPRRIVAKLNTCRARLHVRYAPTIRLSPYYDHDNATTFNISENKLIIEY